jgi:hypothetical protein
VAEFRPDAILQVLAAHAVDYVLIGGLAAALHGSDLATSDVDITPAFAHDNLDRLSAALDELHARVRTDAEPDGIAFAHDADSLARASTWNLVTDYGDLDISFTPAGTTGYSDLRRDALHIEIAGTPVTLASLADVVRSKQAAGRPKDHIALPVLRRLLEDDENKDR